MFASSKTQSDKPEVTLLSKNDEGKIVIVLNLKKNLAFNILCEMAKIIYLGL